MLTVFDSHFNACTIYVIEPEAVIKWTLLVSSENGEISPCELSAGHFGGKIIEIVVTHVSAGAHVIVFEDIFWGLSENAVFLRLNVDFWGRVGNSLDDKGLPLAVDATIEGHAFVLVTVILKG